MPNFNLSFSYLYLWCVANCIPINFGKMKCLCLASKEKRPEHLLRPSHLYTDERSEDPAFLKEAVSVKAH